MVFSLISLCCGTTEGKQHTESDFSIPAPEYRLAAAPVKKAFAALQMELGCILFLSTIVMNIPWLWGGGDFVAWGGDHYMW